MKRNLTKLLSVGFLCLSFFAFGQQRPITGKVVDSNGYPVQDAYVYVEGRDKGVYTDGNGVYTIEAKKGDIIKVEFIGFDTKNIKVKDANKYDVKLSKGEAIELTKVTQMGYRKLSKNDQTGSVVQVGAEDLGKVPLTSVDQALQGKVAGLNIVASSGSPGSVQQIRIRGINSINAGTNPLYVIDGVPVNDQNPSIGGDESRSSFSPLSLLNSNDIESVTVLKDASATAPYGARGANGVILITTKSGKKGDVKFSLSTRYGFQKLANPFPKMLSAKQKYDLLEQALANSSLSSDAKERKRNQYFSSWLKGGKKVNTDWGKVIQRNAPIQEYNISASGGDAKSSFFASLGYNSTKSVIIGGDFQRISANLNYSRKFSKRVKFTTNNLFSNGKQNGITEQGTQFANPMMAAFFLSPTDSPYNPDGSLNLDFERPYNPIFTAENNFDRKELVRFFSSNTLEVKLSNHLNYKNTTSFDFLLDSSHIYWDPNYADGQDYNGYVSQSVERGFTLMTQNFLNYSNSIDGLHNFNISLVQEYQKYKDNYLSGEGKNLAAPKRIYLATANSEFRTFSNFEDRINISYLGMLNYNYNKKYVLDLTYRREGSSKFARGHRYGNFYSVGAAWNMHNEDFIRNIKEINLLKLRASYGKVGNSNIPINEYQVQLSLAGTYDGQPAFAPTDYGDKDLTWEKTANLDVGVDFGLFDNVLTGQVTYFNKKTTDMLSRLQLSATTGYDYQWLNNGEISNKGFEVELSGKLINKKDISLNVSANFASVNNNVDALVKDAYGKPLTTTTSSRSINVGHPIYAWYMPVWGGVNPDNGNPTWYVNPNDKNNPNLKTENYNEAKQVYVGGSALPKYTGGLSANLKVKNFFASVSFYYSGGNKVMPDFAKYKYANNLYSVGIFNGEEGLVNSWTPENRNTDWPKIFLDYYGNRAWGTSTRFLYDGDFIRLRNVQIGYTLPSKWSKKVGLDDITLSLTGVNLWTWVKDSRVNFDPEVRQDGFSGYTAPPVKSVTFNVNINF